MGNSHLTPISPISSGWLGPTPSLIGSESLAVGSQVYVQGVKEALGVSAKARQIEVQEGLYRVREPRESYTRDFDAKNGGLSNYRRLVFDES